MDLLQRVPNAAWYNGGVVSGTTLAIAAAASLAVGTQVARAGDAGDHRARAWAARDERTLPPPPLVEAPEPRPAAGSETGAGGEESPGLPFRLGMGAGAGGLADAAGAVAGFELWGLAGPRRAPYWGELSVVLTPGRFLSAGRFGFLWSRGLAFAAGAAYHLAQAPIEVVAGFQGAEVMVTPLDLFPAPGFRSFDTGAYAGLRALLPLGFLSGFVGTRLMVWFVQHRIEVGDLEQDSVASVPVLGVWFGLGVQMGSWP